MKYICNGDVLQWSYYYSYFLLYFLTPDCCNVLFPGSMLCFIADNQRQYKKKKHQCFVFVTVPFRTLKCT